MTEVLLFHSAHGLTSGVRDFAENLRAAGHSVHVPDLYEGRVFADLEEGLAFAQSTGFSTLLDRARLAAELLPSELVYAGFSLGVLPAQMLAQTRAGSEGALLLSGCVAPSELVANVAEQRALEKAGFLREGRLRSAQWRSGAWHDQFLYACVRGDSAPS